MEQEAVQTAYWRRDRGGRGVLVPTAPHVLELSSLCAAPATFARSYLRERLRRPLSSSVDVPVVHDGVKLVCHGPPTGWAPGVAQRVQDGSLQLGVIRVRVAGREVESRERPVALPQPPGVDTIAARRLASGRLKVGVHSDRGGVGHMEDEHVVHTTSDFGFFCIYDGHGGCQAAQFLREQLHHNVMASPAFHSGNMSAALREGFAKTEADLLVEQQQQLTGAAADGPHARGAPPGGAPRHDCCGSTALVVLLHADSLHLAWLGDCRAVLSRDGAALALTQDHVLSGGAGAASAERERVLGEGGHIEAGRLSGFLEVARAFGDVDHATGRKPVGLSGLPELRSQRLQPGDEFVLLGSDGLWAVVEPPAAVQLARAELQAYGDATMASEKLVEAALKRNADDNITAMVVVLRPLQPDASPRQRPRLSLMKRSASVPASLHAAQAPVHAPHGSAASRPDSLREGNGLSPVGQAG